MLIKNFYSNPYKIGNNKYKSLYKIIISFPLKVINVYMRIYLFKRAQNWQNIHSKYQKCNVYTLSMILKFIFINSLFIKYFEKYWEQVLSIHVILWNTNWNSYTTILRVLVTLLTDFLLILISLKTCSQRTFRIKEFVQFKKILTLNRKKNNWISLHFWITSTYNLCSLLIPATRQTSDSGELTNGNQRSPWISTMPLSNHFEITSLFFSKEKTKSVQFFHVNEVAELILVSVIFL